MEVGGKREIIYLSLRCHHQNDFCIKMGSDESHFNVSVGSDGQSHKTASTNHNLSEEKGEPQRYQERRNNISGLISYSTVHKRRESVQHYTEAHALENRTFISSPY